ncbi:Superoxide dismutase [Cu-Zn] precursor [Escherichia coli IS5]|nr:Superoxide dismutase [Cu-Zn] precursor [Escherichia coli IS5]
MTPEMLVFPSLSSTGVLFSSTIFNPSTGPSIGPSLMASITLSNCVDFRLSFASRGVCPLLLPLPIRHAP